jgi:hypothetical protein
MSYGLKAEELAQEFEQKEGKIVLIKVGEELKEIKNIEFKYYDSHATILEINT